METQVLKFPPEHVAPEEATFQLPYLVLTWGRACGSRGSKTRVTGNRLASHCVSLLPCTVMKHPSRLTYSAAWWRGRDQWWQGQPGSLWAMQSCICCLWLLPRTPCHRTWAPLHASLTHSPYQLSEQEWLHTWTSPSFPSYHVGPCVFSTWLACMFLVL